MIILTCTNGYVINYVGAIEIYQGAGFINIRASAILRPTDDDTLNCGTVNLWDLFYAYQVKSIIGTDDENKRSKAECDTSLET